MPLWTPSGSSDPSSSQPSAWARFWRAHSRLRLTLIKRLGDAQHISAIPLAVFLTVHLAAPAVVPLLGAEGGNQVLLMGREVYKTPITEPILFLSIGVHFLSGALRRTLLSTPPPSLAHGLGLPLTGLLVVHLSGNLFNAPKLGGASFEFVRAGVKEWPIRAGAVYALIAGAGVYHAIGCGRAAVARRFGKRTTVAEDDAKTTAPVKTGKAGAWGWQAFALGLAGWCGVVVIASLALSESGPAWREEGYLAAWRGGVFYR